MTARPQVIMVGTSLDLEGGVAAMISLYRDSKFFERWRVEYIPTNCGGSTLRKTGSLIIAAERFLSLLLRDEGNIIHVHTSSYSSFWRKSLFLAPAFFARRPVVVTLHGGEFRYFYSNKCGPVGKWWIRTVVKKAARFVVLTDGWKQWVLSIVPDARVCIIPNACLDPIYSRVARHSDRNGANVLFLGRLEKSKGFRDLLLAVASVRKEIPAIRLICAGAGNENEVETWIRAAGVEDIVEMRGWVSGTGKSECFMRANLLALPSYAENLPMVILEAMAAEVPVIASTVGGIPDVIENEKDGILMQPGDVQGLAQAIIRLLNNQQLREQIARNGRRKYEKFYSPPSVIPQLEAVYRELGSVPSGTFIEEHEA